MPFIVAAFVTRKPEVSICLPIFFCKRSHGANIHQISPADFQTAYDTTHLPLLKEAVGDAYPDSVTRYYVKRAKSDPEGLKPLSFSGSEETFGYDLVSYLSFADEAAAQKFQQKYGEAQEKIAGNVASFAQLDKFRVIAFQDPIVN
jgi:hypothetical protein